MPPINASMFISMFQPPYNPTLIYPSFQRLVIKMISSRIYSRGYAKHPCTQSACCQGFAVGPSQRYLRVQGNLVTESSSSYQNITDYT